MRWTVCTALALAPLAGCQPPSDGIVRTLPPATAPTPTAAGPIAVRDQLRISVLYKGDDAEPAASVDKVDDQGRVALTTIGPVRVVGLTEPDAAAAITRAYRDAGITAKVSVLDVTRGRAVP